MFNFVFNVMAILCIANSKGGTGKTTLTLNLIPLFKPDLIIDADIHHGISKILGLGKNKIKIVTVQNKEEILKLCKEYRRVLIDCGGFDNDIARYSISQADCTLTPTTDDPTDQFALVEFNKVMVSVSKMVNEELKANIVLNRIHHSRKKFDDIGALIHDLSNLILLDTIIPSSSKLPSFAFKGVACKDKKIKAVFEKLYSELNL